MGICKKRAAKKAEKRAAKAAARAEEAQTRRKGSFLGRCVRRLFVCTLVLGGIVGAMAYLGRPGTGDGEDA